LGQLQGKEHVDQSVTQQTVVHSVGSTSPLEGVIDDSVSSNELDELIEQENGTSTSTASSADSTQQVSSREASKEVKWEARQLTRTASFDIPIAPAESAEGRSASHSNHFGATSGPHAQGGDKKGSRGGSESVSAPGVSQSLDRFGLMSTYPDAANLDVVSAAVTREDENTKNDQTESYRIFRAMAPYIAVHRGSVVVIHVPGKLF
jgi:hypothetical protein